jgi:hypothetical protein
MSTWKTFNSREQLFSLQHRISALQYRLIDLMQYSAIESADMTLNCWVKCIDDFDALKTQIETLDLQTHTYSIDEDPLGPSTWEGA